MLIVFVLAAVVTVIAGMAMEVLLPAGLPDAVVNAIFAPLTLATLGLTTVAWVAARHRGAVRRLVGRRPRLGDALVGLGAGVLGVVVITAGVGLAIALVLDLLGRDIPAVQQHLRDAARDPQTAPILVFSALVVAPIAEELFFRGFVFPALVKRVGLWAGIVLSALIFGFVHLNQTEDLLGGALLLARLVPLGMLFAWLYHWRGTLVIPIIVHAVFNAASVALLLTGLGQG
ncbi:MAG: type II CAAX endopeptidase family protein [Egibacteraceae bacterium]